MSTTRLYLTSGKFEDPVLERISQNIAVDNFKNLERSDNILRKMRKHVYEYVRTLNIHDKRLMVRGYGDHVNAEKMSASEINRYLTELLIVTMSEADFQYLRRQLDIREKNITNYLRDTTRTASASSQALAENARANQQKTTIIIRDIRRNVRTTKQRRKNIRQETLKVHKRFLRFSYSGQKALEEEVSAILGSLNLVELTRLFSTIVGDDFDSQTGRPYNVREVKDLLLDRISYYFALVTGKVPRNAHIYPINLNGEKQIIDIIKQTSFAYAVGGDGRVLSNNEIQAIQREAKERLRQQEIAQKEATRKKDIGGLAFSPFKMRRRRRVNRLANEYQERYNGFEDFMVNNHIANMVRTRAYTYNESGELTPNLVELNRLGAVFGIRFDQLNYIENTYRLVAAYRRIGRFEEKEIKPTDFQKQIAGRFNLGQRLVNKRLSKRKSEQSAREAIYLGGTSSSELTSGIVNNLSLSGSTYAKLPTISYGELLENPGIIFSNRAVPVYNVNDKWDRRHDRDRTRLVSTRNNRRKDEDNILKAVSSLLGYSMKAQELLNERDNKTVSFSDLTQDDLNLLYNVVFIGDLKDRFSAGSKRRTNAAKVRKQVGLSQIGMDTMSRDKFMQYVNISKEKGYQYSPSGVKIREQEEEADVHNERHPLNGLTYLKEIHSLIAEIKEDSKNSVAPIDRSMKIASNYSSVGINQLKDKLIRPVLVVNDELKTRDGQLSDLIGLIKKIPLFGALGAITGVGGASAVDNIFSGINKYATGGYSTTPAVKSPRVTQFISGDSLNTRPNPELVSIDWDTGKYSVKPIPDGKETGVVKTMTPAERAASMRAVITSPLIKYNRSLSDNDFGDKTAIKVYSVNPGITDLVDIGQGKQASLIQLVADIATLVYRLEEQFALTNTLTANIAESSSQTALNTAVQKGSSANPLDELNANLSNVLRGK